MTDAEHFVMSMIGKRIVDVIVGDYDAEHGATRGELAILLDDDTVLDVYGSALTLWNCSHSDRMREWHLMLERFKDRRKIPLDETSLDAMMKA